jgi:hypothetical protein
MTEEKSQRRYDGVTYIYGLVDPRNHQLRYVGKTVLTPSRRLATHRWQARKAKHKRHVLAWISSLEVENLVPELIEIERVEPFGDWEEAEQFWIAYYKFVGADLCNLTIGGEGATGAKVSEENKAKKRARCGPLSPMFGKPMLPQTRRALFDGRDRMRSDPVRFAKAESNRLAALTPEILAAATSRILAVMADPKQLALREIKRKAACRTDEFREKVSAQSSELWATKREVIIAAQNTGKGDEFKRKQSIARKKIWTDPDCAYWKVFLTSEKREEVRAYLRQGMKGVEASKKFGLSQSRISQIKQGA